MGWMLALAAAVLAVLVLRSPRRRSARGTGAGDAGTTAGDGGTLDAGAEDDCGDGAGDGCDAGGDGGGGDGGGGD
ncbi:MAG: hypothetical protein IPI38_13775 [Gemmatimonadetes bacterium]|jgi:hypothetical protein|nr:hypothetical protein [Gemmatimonadota bacterium]MBK7349461.1 hypothetical protein [Gemmatimonadota bacterium]MBK7716474.1 hypothetical protein [Gemmatimonadota bacterium]MBK7784091.1 hypothetical protein [Gemmatimonadota bacterium]MBP9202033.1 hypothetical protein [Gemmatimonadales bacterium]